jgi:NaMN:DMB phosphoribosyltransferase
LEQSVEPITFNIAKFTRVKTAIKSDFMNSAIVKFFTLVKSLTMVSRIPGIPDASQKIEGEFTVFLLQLF